MPNQGPFISSRKRRHWSRRRLVAGVGLLGLALGAYLFLAGRTDDVRKGTEVEFRASTRPQERAGTDWPVFHRDLAHRGYLASKLKPPFKRRWLFGGRVLMEFPPILADGALYFIRNIEVDCQKFLFMNKLKAELELRNGMVVAT